MAYRHECFYGATEACGISTIDTTTAENIIVTAQWSAAKVGNIFTYTKYYIKFRSYNNRFEWLCISS
ncbi:hypothetical protein M0Q50_02730 [bacterium]|nr:hypothetical protein [bacterium]